VGDSGGWHMAALYDGKPLPDILAAVGATISVDMTVFRADITSPWMNVGMVINAQNHDDNGNAPHNNIGWQDLGQLPVNVVESSGSGLIFELSKRGTCPPGGPFSHAPGQKRRQGG